MAAAKSSMTGRRRSDPGITTGGIGKASMERYIGQLQGLMQGILDNQDEIKQTMRDHIDQEERLMKSNSDRFDKHDERIKGIENKQAEQKGRLWGLTAIASGGGVIGGLVHSIGEFFVKGSGH